MKGRAHLEWLQLLQLNKCGWMIISFPSRNKRKRRQRRIITLSKTIKSDFEVVAPPNLSNISAAEMAFWAQPTGAVGPLRLGPRGRAPLAHSCAAQCCQVAECVPTQGALQHSGWVRRQPRGVPWSPPCIKTIWARVRSRSTRARTSFVTEHCVNKHTKVVGCHRLSLHVVLLNAHPPSRIVHAQTVCCITGGLSISQLKNCSQDSFPAGLRSSVVPLHPEELRSTHACQTEYTLIPPDWEQQIFLELLDITEANKHCKPILLSPVNRKCWDGPLSAALIIFCSCRKW